MRIRKIECGNFKCDGGALFGVIPKALWTKYYPCDEMNRCNLTMRNLLVEVEEKKILIDVGSGMNFSDRYIRNNGVNASSHLLNSLKSIGVSPDEITDILLTHLHWDHCCGAFDFGDGTHRELFSNATYHVSDKQWINAHANNPRESAAYHFEDLDLMEQSGRLNLLSNGAQPWEFLELFYMDGHTPGQIIPVIHHEEQSVVFAADFIPTMSHIPQLWIASYDLFPIDAMNEKIDFISMAYQKKWVLFFQHDYYNESAKIVSQSSSFKGEPFNTIVQ
ncbi:MBL fold metallo-hydrolase [Halosquirtibacter laminarini]|uniref:MBL fold metallo-hydrolase n=1 Tax=Halosquirtibacter laminarini TaxID=3374600 RepID=A0AC61NQW2_9BACT|nr:MBL fold metallo-hydrolase [Prolixibacteraceae bacterium]